MMQKKHSNKENDSQNNKHQSEFELIQIQVQSLGVGTFGVVVLSLNKITGEKVAIKILEREQQRQQKLKIFTRNTFIKIDQTCIII
ncbi:unnamed protein product [Paramecium sonneborni]|uniref:Protein kinase domain-containing protein n=1 Tax=Paramecium sonneborni TaxID=65129 RepID=A0A8S1JZV1_9CILI|nr:unnamed protein product [Paramecium sonneborni]